MEPRAAHRFVSLLGTRSTPSRLSEQQLAGSLVVLRCVWVSRRKRGENPPSRTRVRLGPRTWGAPFWPENSGRLRPPFLSTRAAHQLAIRPPTLPEPAPLQRSDRVRHPRMRTHPRAMFRPPHAPDPGGGSGSSTSCPTHWLGSA